jgi:hypothetical protein
MFPIRQLEPTDTPHQDTATPTDTLGVRTVKVGPGEYAPVGDDCPNRATIRAMTKRKGGFKRDKPFKGARAV